MSWSRGVFSDMVAELGYDDENQELLVTWAKGRNRQGAYIGVPEDVADACSRSASVGGYINSNIKGAYPYESR